MRRTTKHAIDTAHILASLGSMYFCMASESTAIFLLWESKDQRLKFTIYNLRLDIKLLRMFEQEGVLTKLVGAFQRHGRKDSTDSTQLILGIQGFHMFSQASRQTRCWSRFDKPHYPPKQIFVSDKMAEQPELISDNLLEKAGENTESSW